MSQIIPTREESDKLCEEVLIALLLYAGGPSYLAKMLDVDACTCSAWKYRKKISKAGAILVESHPTLGKKFTANALRPDIRNIHNMGDNHDSD